MNGRKKEMQKPQNKCAMKLTYKKNGDLKRKVLHFLWSVPIHLAGALLLFQVELAAFTVKLTNIYLAGEQYYKKIKNQAILMGFCSSLHFPPASCSSLFVIL